jgi:hypothetical protein
MSWKREHRKMPPPGQGYGRIAARNTISDKKISVNFGGDPK